MSENDHYTLCYLARHLTKADRCEELHTLISESTGKQLEWAEARHGLDGSYNGYLNDLTLLQGYVAKLDKAHPGIVGRQIRYALIESSIHSLATTIPANLLIALVKHRVPGWSHEAALSYALQSTDPTTLPEVLQGLAPSIPEELLAKALGEACSISNESHRADSLSALGPRLCRFDLLHTALNASLRITAAGPQAKSLSALAPSFSSQLLTITFQIAEMTGGDESIKRVLIALIPGLPLELLDNVLPMVSAIKDNASKAALLEILAPRLQPHLHTAALNAIRSCVEHSHAAANSLVSLIPHLSSDLLTEALHVTLAIPNADDRILILAELAPRLSIDLLTEPLAAAIVEASEHSAYYNSDYIDKLLAVTPNPWPALAKRVLSGTSSIEDETIRSCLIVTLISQHWPVDMRDIFAVTTEIQDEELRASDLCALISPKWPDLLPQILTAALKMEGPKYRTQVLVALLPHLSNQEHSNLLRKLDPEGDFEVLVALAKSASPELHNQILTTIGRMTAYIDIQTEVLTALVPRLQSNLVPYAWEIARKYPFPSRSEIFRALAPSLPSNIVPSPQIVAAAARGESPDEIVSGLIQRLSRTDLISLLQYPRWVLCVESLAPYLDPPLLDSAWVAACKITEPESCISVLNTISRHLSEEARVQKLELARKTRYRSYETIQSLALHLSPSSLADVVIAAGDIERDDFRLAAMRTLAPRLKSTPLDFALKVARETKNEYFRSEILCVLAPNLHQHQLTEAWSVALTIKDAKAFDGAFYIFSEYRIKALHCLTSKVTPELLEEILTLVRTLENAQERESILVNLIRNSELYPGNSINKIFDAIENNSARERCRAELLRRQATNRLSESPAETLDLIRQIEDTRQRVKTTQDILPNLPPEYRASAAKECLSLVQQIEMGSERDRALHDLAQGFPPEFWTFALEAIRGITDTRQHAEALRGLAQRLPMGLIINAWVVAQAGAEQAKYAQDLDAVVSFLDPHALSQSLKDLAPWWPVEAIQGASRIKNPQIRTETLTALVPSLPSTLYSSALTEALANVRQLGDLKARATALVALARYMPYDLLSATVDLTCMIEEENPRASVLVALAPSLPPTLADKLLLACHEIHDITREADVLKALAPHLSPDALLAETLTQVQAPTDLRALTLGLSSLQYREVLEAVRTTDSEATRGAALMALTPHLPSEVGEDALAVVRSITAETARLDILLALVPKLSGDALQAGLAEILTLITGAEKNIRGRALALLAPLLSPSHHEQALSAIRIDVNGIKFDIPKIFGALAPRMSRKIQVGALNIIQEIDYEPEQAEAVCLLAPHLHPDLVTAALDIALGIMPYGDSFVWTWRAKALSSLLSILKPELRQSTFVKALESARRARGDERAGLLHNLALQAPAHQRSVLLDEALAASKLILETAVAGQAKQEYIRALADLAPDLPPKTSESVFAEALSIAVKIPDDRIRMEMLHWLASRLSSSNQRQALIAARLTAVQNHDSMVRSWSRDYPRDAEERVTRREKELALYRAEVPLALIPYLPADLLKEVLRLAGGPVEHEIFKVKLLTAIATRLPAELDSDFLAVASALRDSDYRAEVLRTFAPRLPQHMIPVVIEQLRRMDTSTQQASLLAQLAQPWTLEIRQVAYGTWLNLTHAASKKRTEMLHLIESHVGLLMAIGGVDDASEAARAILDVGRWWP